MRIGTETTQDPQRAIAIAFGVELKTARVFAASEPYRPFNEIGYAWGSKRMYRGPESAIRELVLQNLIRISTKPRFTAFRVDVADDYVVRIPSFFPDCFEPVQIWKAGEEYFANGNSDFVAEGQLAKDSRIRVETTEKQEAEQRQKRDALIQRDMRLRCNLCKQAYPVAACGDVHIKENDYVFFMCPRCRVGVLVKVG